MARSPNAPANLRNGLKWRDGRPRWEPSPANRALGLGGFDLKTADGSWMSRGAAIDAADARHAWARTIREGLRTDAAGGDARQDLRAALEAMHAPATAEDQHRRQLVQDLLDRARALLDMASDPVAANLSPRSIQAMVDGYFKAVDDGKVIISDATRTNYERVGRNLVARFPGKTVAEIHRGHLRDWYEHLRDTIGLPTANLNLGCGGAFFKWATLQNPPWIENSPCTRLHREQVPGRLVMWTEVEELSFVAWCDAHGFLDVGDATTFGIWTGARPHDLCAAKLEVLTGDVWPYVPHKGKRKGREAMPGLVERLRVRIDRRRREAAAAPVTPLGGHHFLFDMHAGKPFTVRSLNSRLREAKAAAVLSGQVPETIADKTGQDWRDTAITRLWEALDGFERIPAWTGHSPDDAARILREHYVSLREGYARESAQRLEAYMLKNGFGVPA